jgi:outer membrane protein OmpA-like peptidoglycan-associated protein
MKTLSLTAATAIGALLVGCTSQTPTELKNARTAYQEAAQSPGANLAAPDVYEAKKSLDVAERAFADDGDGAETRDLAYVAERKALIARSKGNTAIAMQQHKEALAEAERVKEQQASAMRQQLGQTKDQLAQSQQQLDSERQARVVAEQRTQDALARIEGMTTKQDPRGLVMTISGSVLFATGKSTLLPTAQKRLSDVASALRTDPRSITIVGHTDSTGSDDTNQQLSQRRAEAVRTYLTTHGVSEDRVQAQGAGESQPIADNKSAEGRANNRRVEIILHGEAPMKGKTDQQPKTNQPTTEPQF